MGNEVKESYERKLKVAQWARRWLIIPSCILAGGLLLRSLFVGVDLVMWLFIFGFNLLNYWMNGQTQRLYHQVIDSCERKSQVDRIRELNPHRK